MRSRRACAGMARRCVGAIDTTVWECQAKPRVGSRRRTGDMLAPDETATASLSNGFESHLLSSIRRPHLCSPDIFRVLSRERCRAPISYDVTLRREHARRSWRSHVAVEACVRSLWRPTETKVCLRGRWRSHCQAPISPVRSSSRLLPVPVPVRLHVCLHVHVRLRIPAPIHAPTPPPRRRGQTRAVFAS